MNRLRDKVERPCRRRRERPARRLRARAGAGRRASSRATRRSTWVPTTAACWWPRPRRAVFASSRPIPASCAWARGCRRPASCPTRPWSRSLAALKVCAEKIRRRKVVRVKAVATQACRGATNGPDFVAAWPRRPASAADHHARGRGSAVGGRLHEPVRPRADAALVVDVGGGSTELSWVDLKGGGLDSQAAPVRRLEAADQGLAVDPGRRRHPGRALSPRASGLTKAGSGPWSTTSRRGSRPSRTPNRCASSSKAEART
jgi:hypothetical protein